MKSGFLACRTAGHVLVVVAALLAVTSGPAEAGAKYWDTNGSTAGSGNANGTWSVGGGSWSTNAGGTVATTTWADGDAAVFAAGTDFGTGRAITLSGTVAPISVSIEEGGVTFGSGTMAIGSGGLTVTPNNAQTINSAVTIAAAQSWANNGTADTTVGGAVAINNTLTLNGTGSGKIILSVANTGTGGVVVNGQTVRFGNAASFGASGGLITLTSGRLYTELTSTTVQNSLTVNGDAAIEYFRATNGQTLTFSGTTTFASGLTTFSVVRSGTASQANTITFSGPLNLDSDFTVAWDNNNTGNALNFNAGANAVTWSANREITINATTGGSVSLTGNLAGGSNTLRFTGSNTGTFTFGTLTGACGGLFVNVPNSAFGSTMASFSGGVTIQSGTATVSAASTGTPVASGPFGVGTLTLAGIKLTTATSDITIGNAITINGNATIEYTFTNNNKPLTLSGTITFASGLTTLTVNQTANQSGDAVALSGNLNIDTTFTLLGSLLNSNSLILGGSGKNITFSANRQITFSNTFVTGGNIVRGVLAGGTSTLTLAGTSPVTFGDGTAAISGACGGVVVNGPTVTFTGNNSFSGGVTVRSGVAVASHVNSFGTGRLTLAGGSLRSSTTLAPTNALLVTSASYSTNSANTLTITANANFQAAPAGGTLLTKTGAGTLAFATTKKSGVRLNGNADLLSTNKFTLLNKSAGTLTFSGAAGAWEDATMWTSSGVANTTLYATLNTGARMATIAGEGSASFASTDLGYVQFSGLTAGTKYKLTVDFAGTPDLAAIKTALQAAHPGWSSFTDDGSSRVSFVATALATGAGYFGWDNKHEALGANVEGLAVLAALPAIANAAVTSKGSDFIDFPYSLTTTGAAPTRVSLYWGPNTHSQTGWENTNHLTGFKTAGSASVHVGSLASGTTYYYQFRASNEYGIVWAPDTLFAATSAGLVNDPVSARTYSGATLNGTLGDTGGGTVDVIVHWGTNNLGATTGGWDGTHTFAGQSAGPSGLALSHAAATVPDRVYYYKFRMTNETLHTGSWAPNFTTFNTYAAHIAASGSPSEDGTPGTFTISRVAAALGASWTVNFALTGGAGNGADYVTVSPLSVTLGASDTSKTVSIVPIYDGVADDGTVEMELATATPATVLLEPGKKTLAIADYLVPITVTAADGTAVEASTDDGRFTISRPALGTNAAVTVNYTIGGTADSGTDYTLSPAGTSVTLGVGRTSTNIAVDAKADFAIDDGETVSLTLASGPYAVDTPGPVTVTITDRPPVYWYDKQDGSFTANTTWTNGAGGSGHPVAGDVGVIDSQTVSVTGSEDPLAAIELGGGTLYNNTGALTHSNTIAVTGSSTVQFGTASSPSSSNVKWTFKGDVTFGGSLGTMTVNIPRTTDRNARVIFAGNINLNTDFTLAGAYNTAGGGNSLNFNPAPGRVMTFPADRVITINTTANTGTTRFDGPLSGGSSTLTFNGSTTSLGLGTEIDQLVATPLTGTTGGIIIDMPNATVVADYRNAFSGGVTLRNGVLNLGGGSTGTPVTSGPVGVGTLTLSGGKLQNNGGGLTIGNAVQVDGTSTIEWAASGNNATWAFAGDTTFASGLSTLTINHTAAVTGNGFAFTGNLSFNTDFTIAGTANTSGGITLGAAGRNLTWGAARHITLTQTGGFSFRGVLDGGSHTLTLTGTAGVTFGDAIAAISGTCGGVIFSGPTVTLGVANSYAGDTTVAAGWVQVGHNAGFSTGALTLNGGKVSSTDGNSRTIANTLTIGASALTIGDAAKTGAVVFSGPKTLVTSCALTTVANATLSTGAMTVTVPCSIAKDGAGTLTTSGAWNLVLPGSIDLVASNAVRLVTRNAGTLSDSMTLQSSGGLWTKSANADRVDAVLGNLKGSMVHDGRVSFADEDAGCVEITGLIAGTRYPLLIRLGAIDGGKSAATVAAELSTNSRFSDVGVGEAGESVSFKFVSPVTGTAYLVWDNNSGSVNDLGANLTGVWSFNRGTIMVLR